jgi:hypothetical protein
MKVILKNDYKNDLKMLQKTFIKLPCKDIFEV